MISTLRRAFKNTAHNYSSVKVKTREATSNDQQLPTAGELNFLAAATYDSLRFVEVMCIIWKRLCDSPKCWRHVYKSLIVLEHLLVYGNSSVIEQTRANMYVLRRLESFQLYEGSVDHGLVVRDIVSRILQLLNEPETLKARRDRALAGLKKRRGTMRNAIEASSTSSATVAAASSVAMVETARRVERERRPSQILQSAPTTTDDEEHQLRLALALSRMASASLQPSQPIYLQQHHQLDGGSTLSLLASSHGAIEAAQRAPSQSAYEAIQRAPSQSAYEAIQRMPSQGAIDAIQRAPSQSAYDAIQRAPAHSEFDATQRAPSHIAYEATQSVPLHRAYDATQRVPSHGEFAATQRAPSHGAFEATHRTPSHGAIEAMQRAPYHGEFNAAQSASLVPQLSQLTINGQMSMPTMPGVGTNQFAVDWDAIIKAMNPAATTQYNPFVV